MASPPGLARLRSAAEPGELQARDLDVGVLIEHDYRMAIAVVATSGTCNVLVHQYLEIDRTQVFAAIPLALRDYGEYVRQAAQWMREHAERDE